MLRCLQEEPVQVRLGEKHDAWCWLLEKDGLSGAD
jgi:hypothetical protein